MSYDKVKELDDVFGLTDVGNSEIACDWFKHAIEQNYKPAYPALESFLVNVGRRKFLSPLYERLAVTDQNKKWAQEVYKKARPGYHAVSYNSIDKVLGL